MEALFGFFASVVILVHFAFICFVVLGGLLVLRWPRLIWFHLPAAIWGALIEFAGVRCPLTPLEKWLRSLAGHDVYTGGFIQHYITSVVYPEGLTREMQWILGALVLIINGVIYWRLWRRRSSSERPSGRMPMER